VPFFGISVRYDGLVKNGDEEPRLEPVVCHLVWILVRGGCDDGYKLDVCLNDMDLESLVWLGVEQAAVIM
jgi:hypothetical protein